MEKFSFKSTIKGKKKITVKYGFHYIKGNHLPYFTITGLIEILDRNGFVYVKSNNGSHQKYFNPQQNITVAVPLHTKELKKGLEQAILKQAGLKR